MKKFAIIFVVGIVIGYGINYVDSLSEFYKGLASGVALTIVSTLVIAFIDWARNGVH